jgi:signal transduction histidine kinase
MLKNEASGELEVRAVVATNGPEPPSQKYQLSKNIVRQTIQSEQPTIWQAESKQGPFFATERADANARVTAAVALPLIVLREKIGILGLAKRRKEVAFSQGDVELLSVLASQAGTAIQNARLFTRLRNAYDKLSALDHLKSEFISVVAHELRTPLAEIATYLALLEQEAPGEKPYLQGIARAADRLSSLMDDITDLKFLEAGQVELRRTELSLPQLLAEVVEQLGPLAACKRQRITTQIHDDCATVLMDGPKIKVVLKNLISNAVRFTPEGGEITVQAQISGNTCRIAVHDTGIGIPPEEWEWIFKPFYQLESSLRREHGGMGTGLALAKNLVELHGGRIWVESTVGQGSTFYFTIPDCLR